MKYSVILGLGASALAVPFSSDSNEDLMLTVRDLSGAQTRGFSHIHPKEFHAPLNSQHPSLLPHSLNNKNSKHLQRRTNTPPPARRTSSQKQLGRTTSTVRFPSPDKLASSPSLSTPKRNTLTHATSLKSQSSLVSLYSSPSPSRESSPWRHHRDPITPPNTFDSARTSRSPVRNPQRQPSFRGGSPWHYGGGAVHDHDHAIHHSILGFNPSDPHPHPPLRVPSHGSLSEKTDASPMGPGTPFGRTPRQGEKTPLTPSTPLHRSVSDVGEK